MAQKIHCFRAQTLGEAARKMRQTLGESAVVIGTRHVTEGGLFGLFGKRLIELTASVPELHSASRKVSAAERKYQTSEALPKKDERDSVAYYRQLVKDAQSRMARQKPAGRTSATRSPDPVEEPFRPVAEVSGGPAVAPVIPFEHPGPAYESTLSLDTQMHEIHEMLTLLLAESPDAATPVEFKPHYQRLLNQGISRHLAASLLAGAVKDRDVMRNAELLRERLGKEIEGRVSATHGIGLTAGQARLVALVGPTGVGKTTSLAKLAAAYTVRHRVRVALITADTYRVAAPEQLNVYAKIIGIPMVVVDDPKEIARAARRFNGYDLVLIDTAGTGQFNLQQMTELKETLAAACPHEVMLVMAANTRLDDMRQVARNFGALGPTSILFSKLDETRQYGPLFTLASETGLPLTYFRPAGCPASMNRPVSYRCRRCRLSTHEKTGL